MPAHLSTEPMPPRVLVLLAEGFEEIEAVTPIDLLRRAGANILIAALTEELNVLGRCGITIRADLTLAKVAGEIFDCLLIPGGPGVRLLRADPGVRACVQAHVTQGSWLAAICAAPTVLLDAGLLEGRRYTAHQSVANELPQLDASQRVVVDGRLVTSRGAGTAMDFGLLLVEKLFSAAKSSEIARSICA